MRHSRSRRHEQVLHVLVLLQHRQLELAEVSGSSATA